MIKSLSNGFFRFFIFFLSTFFQNHFFSENYFRNTCLACSGSRLLGRNQVGGGGEQGALDPPLKNHKNIGFLSDIGPDPLKKYKATSQHSMFDHHRHAKWRFAGGPMMAR